MLYKLLGYTIYFWSGDAVEPVHVHVCKGRPTENATKIWVGERVILEHNKSKIPDADLLKILRFVSQNKKKSLNSGISILVYEFLASVWCLTRCFFSFTRTFSETIS
mgnify:CR=1 FL=1